MQKTRIQQNFDRASQSYDRVASIQKHSAQQLVSLLQHYFPHFYPASILDIGTGTGYIPTALLPIFPTSQYLLNDLSENMLSQTRLKLGPHPNLNFLLGDIEAVQFAPHDLIISNFALQWTTQLTRLLYRLYKHANLLAFSCLLEGTFAEWAALFTEYALLSPTYSYPTEHALTTYLVNLGASYCYVNTQDFTLTVDSPAHFIKYLQQLGANTSQQFFTSTQLKMLLKHPHAFTTTYKVCFILIGNL
jgi:malonyl-CoA O-methyltransferase